MTDAEVSDAKTLTAVLELVASEQGDCMSWLLKVLKHSTTGFALADLHRKWQSEEIEELATVAVKAARDLDRLESCRRFWRHPRQMIDDPHIAALYSFALRRRSRVTGISRGRRLDMIGRRLKVLSDREHRRRELKAFLREPVTPVDREWLHDFLKRPAKRLASGKKRRR